jgi:hypothetical protein
MSGASIQQPINSDGSSVFKANRGVVPVKFALSMGGVSTCILPAAAILMTRIDASTPGVVNESTYVTSADTGSNFRISDCQYYNLVGAASLPAGRYRVDINIANQAVGGATFSLK